MGSRTLPIECHHGRVVDWGDFGPCQGYCHENGHSSKCPDYEPCPDCEREVAEATARTEATGGVCVHCGIVVAREDDGWVGALSGSPRCRRSPTGRHERQQAPPLRDAARLRAAIEQAVTELRADHRPEWVSEQAKAAGKEPWCCVMCGAADGGWPCTASLIADDLAAALEGEE